MSENQLQQVKVLAALNSGLLTNSQAAKVLNLSVRTIQRKKKAYATEGDQSVIHKNTGHQPSNRISDALRAQIAHILTTDLQGYNVAHATDILNTEWGISCSESTVRRIFKEYQLTPPGKRRRRHYHLSRRRRPCEGEMVQTDASQYDWLSNGKILNLHGFIDDATGKILALHLCEQETFDGYRQCLLTMNAEHHLPQSLCTDGRTVFYSPAKDQTPSDEEALAGVIRRETDFVRGLRELGTIHILAHSPQSKGRIERLWRTLQDRLPKDLERRGIHTIQEANAYFPAYIEAYNAKFSVPAENPELRYLPSVSDEEIRITLSHRTFRQLRHDAEFSFQNSQYVLSRKDRKKVPAGTSAVEVRSYSDFGVRVHIPRTEFVFTPEIIQPKPSIPKPKHTEEELRKIRHDNGVKGKEASPWRFGL
jgi:transposase